jgi:hypothetical protein
MKQMDKIWNKRMKISKSTARLMLDSPEGSDKLLGIRESRDFSKIISDRRKKIFCFGGSTTYGHGVTEQNTWPSFLESSEYLFVNCGVIKNDLKASLITLVNILRLGFKPDAVIFLDGINEKNGFTAYETNNVDEYIDFDTNYHNMQIYLNSFQFANSRVASILYGIFGDLGKNFYLIYGNKQIGNKIKDRIFKRKQKFDYSSTVDKQKYFTKVAAKSYLDSKKMIVRILSEFGINDYFFFLQPCYYDLSNLNEPSARGSYLDDLYTEICYNDNEIINLQYVGNFLNEDCFFNWAHMNGSGNEILSKEIWEIIKDKIS